MQTHFKFLCMACTVLLCYSCGGNNPQTTSGYSEYEKPDTTNSVQEMKDYHYSAEVKVGQTRYTYDIVREVNDTLPLVTGDDGERYAEKGRVESISGVLDVQTGTASFRAAFPNPTGLLHSGGAGNVLMTEQVDSALTIPQGATYELQDKVFAYRVVDGKARATRIEVTPLDDGKRYIVRSGLRAGETIVAEGVGLLQDGSPVTVKNEERGMRHEECIYLYPQGILIFNSSFNHLIYS